MRSGRGGVAWRGGIQRGASRRAGGSAVVFRRRRGPWCSERFEFKFDCDERAVTFVPTKHER